MTVEESERATRKQRIDPRLRKADWNVVRFEAGVAPDSHSAAAARSSQQTPDPLQPHCVFSPALSPSMPRARPLRELSHGGLRSQGRGWGATTSAMTEDGKE